MKGHLNNKMAFRNSLKIFRKLWN